MKLGYFVTGTDTGVGKTVVSSILSAGMRAAYWKPVQTGAEESRDSDFVRKWNPKVYPEVYMLRAPLSPHAAASQEGVDISFERIVAATPAANCALVAEGAGGVMVPLSEHHLMIDLIQALSLLSIIVSRSCLGTVNHTLLTLEALRQRKIAIAGVVLMGARNRGNRTAIERYGQVPVVGEILPAERFSEAWLQDEFMKLDLPENPERNAPHA